MRCLISKIRVREMYDSDCISLLGESDIRIPFVYTLLYSASERDAALLWQITYILCCCHRNFKSAHFVINRLLQRYFQFPSYFFLWSQVVSWKYYALCSGQLRLRYNNAHFSLEILKKFSKPIIIYYYLTISKFFLPASYQAEKIMLREESVCGGMHPVSRITIKKKQDFKYKT